jgi:hypothetical protein
VGEELAGYRRLLGLDQAHHRASRRGLGGRPPAGHCGRARWWSGRDRRGNGRRAGSRTLLLASVAPLMESKRSSIVSAGLSASRRLSRSHNGLERRRLVLLDGEPVMFGTKFANDTVSRST